MLKKISSHDSKVFENLEVAIEILRSAGNSDEVMDLVVKIFLQLGFERVRIWKVDRENNSEIFGAKSSYIPDEIFRKIRVSLQEKKSSPYFAKALTQRKPFVNRVNKLLKKIPTGPKKIETVEFPMIAGRKLIGTIGVDNNNKKLPPVKELERLMTFVNFVGVTLDRLMLTEELEKSNERLKIEVEEATAELEKKNAELEKMAFFDSLTDLPNRRSFEKILDEEFKKANLRNPLTLVMIDIDFLKQINDEHGHGFGDSVIKKISDVFRHEKGFDFVGRYAGDEFVALIKKKNKAARQKVFERVLKKIRSTVGQSISLGAATHPASGAKNSVDLIRLADDALYHAKHTGRNKVVYTETSDENIVPLAIRREEMQAIERHGTFITEYLSQREALNKISEILRKSPNENIAFERVAKVFEKILYFDRVYIYLKEKEGDEFLRLKTLVGITSKQKIKALFEEGFEIIAPKKANQILKKKKVSEIFCSEISPKVTVNMPTGRGLAIPLIGRTGTIGIIILAYDDDRTFSEFDLRFFLTLGDQIENGIVKIRATAQVKNFNKQLKKEVSDATREIRQYSKDLEKSLAENEKLRDDEIRTHFEIITALVTSLEEKDAYTRGHSKRVSDYSVAIGKEMGLDPKKIQNLRYAGILHDIGKLAIDQVTLNKEEKLTETERGLFLRHPESGAKIVGSVNFLRPIARFILQHHERWDGCGYPRKLKGKRISLEARIISVADAYDAMTTRRSYSGHMSKAAAIRELEKNSGTQFDPEVVKTFVKILKRPKIKIRHIEE